MTNYHQSMRTIDLDLDLLRCFVAVAAAGSFTAGGERIGLTQSGVSVRVRKLEERLGARVLERTTRAVTLTAPGELLLGYARRLLELHDEAVQRLTGPTAEGALRVGIVDYFAPHHLPGLLARFRGAYPRVRLEVRTGLGLDLLPGFERGELDVVVAGQEGNPLEGRALLEEPLMWCGAPAPRLAPEAPVPLVCLPAPCSHRQAGVAALDTVGRAWEPVYTSSSVAGVQAAVRAGLGVAVLPRSATGEGCEPVATAAGLPPLPNTTVAVFTRPGASAALGNAFAGFLEQALARENPVIGAASDHAGTLGR